MALPHILLRLLVRSGLVRCLPGISRLAGADANFLHYCSDRVLIGPGGHLADLFEPPPADVIDLSCGVPRMGVSLDIPRQSAERRAWPAPWGLPQLRIAVAEKLHLEQQLAANPQEEVLITHGAAGALHTILDAFVNRGDRVVLFDPTSPLFTLALRAHGARIRWIPSWNEDGRARFQSEDLERSLRRAKLLVLASPGNPLGGVIAAEDLERIAWWADRHDVLIATDECLAPFVYEGEWSAIGTQERARKRTLTVGSVSKSHGLPALRVGWLAGHRSLVRACQVSAALRMTTVSSHAQHLAASVLRRPGEAFGPVVSELAARRRYAYERLQVMGLKPSWPAGGFFFWVPVWEMGYSGKVFAERLRAEKGVQVTPGDLFGPSGLGHVRISFIADDGRLREGLGRLAEFLGMMQKQPVAELSRAA